MCAVLTARYSQNVRAPHSSLFSDRLLSMLGQREAFSNLAMRKRVYFANRHSLSRLERAQRHTMLPEI